MKDAPIAGLFCISFGKQVSLWKKGSMPEFFPLHAMELLYHETFSWAHAHGYKYCDFGALNRGIAESLIQGKPLSFDQKKSRDIFNLGFGGQPVLLPEAYIYFSNLLLTIYRLFIRGGLGARYLKKMVN